MIWRSLYKKSFSNLLVSLVWWFAGGLLFAVGDLVSAKIYTSYIIYVIWNIIGKNRMLAYFYIPRLSNDMNRKSFRGSNLLVLTVFLSAGVSASFAGGDFVSAKIYISYIMYFIWNIIEKIECSHIFTFLGFQIIWTFAVQKNHLRGQILYRSLVLVKKNGVSFFFHFYIDISFRNLNCLIGIDTVFRLYFVLYRISARGYIFSDNFCSSWNPWNSFKFQKDHFL